MAHLLLLITIHKSKLLWIIISPLYSRTSFLHSFLILGPTQALISSIGVPPSGCAVLYSMLHRFLCNLAGMARRVLYAGGHIRSSEQILYILYY
jgi:hypothetical protein